MALLTKYKGGVANLNSPSSVCNMIETEMNLMFGPETFYEFEELLKSTRGVTIEEAIVERIAGNHPLYSFMHMIQWDDLSIGDIKFSAFDDRFFQLIHNAEEANSIQYKKNGVVVMEMCHVP